MGASSSSEKSSANGGEEDDRAVRKSLQNEEENPVPTEKFEAGLNGKDESRFSEARFASICNALLRIARLQREATTARIDARQKHREASIKRQDVWSSDARFMSEVQRLTVRGRVAGFEQLSRLATECQKARDFLGPVEQETIEAEQRWEGTIWKLRHAEDNFYTEFKDEFETAEANASGSPISVASSPYRSSSETESHASIQEIFEIESHISHRTAGSVVSASRFAPFLPGEDNLSDFDDELGDRDFDLMGMDTVGVEQRPSYEYARDWDSGIGDIEEILARSPPPSALGKSVPLPEGEYINSLTSLLTDFTSVRERIDKWLEGTVLSSRFEAMTYFGILRSKFEEDIPSNWAQLTIAYWELRGKPDLTHKEIAPKSTPKGKQSGPPSMPKSQSYFEPRAVADADTHSYAHTSSNGSSNHTQSMSLRDSISMRKVLGSSLSSRSPPSHRRAQYGFDSRYLEEQPEPP